MRQRFDIVVTIKRGEHEPFSYTQYMSVHPGKVEKVLAETVNDLNSNITRGGRYTSDIQDFDTYSIITSGPVTARVEAIEHA